MTKGNDGTGNNPSRDEWQTPQKLWDQLNEQYKFRFDCCASPTNKKTQDYSENLQIYGWMTKDGWMNPPFSKAFLMFKHFFKKVHNGVAIYRCDNIETKVWELIFSKADWIFVFNKRIEYEGQEGKGARFGSALIGYNVEPPKLTNGSLLICK